VVEGEFDGQFDRIPSLISNDFETPTAYSTMLRWA